MTLHKVQTSWQDKDKPGFNYLHGGPPEDKFAGFPGLNDPRLASPKKRGSPSMGSFTLSQGRGYLASPLRRHSRCRQKSPQ